MDTMELLGNGEQIHVTLWILRNPYAPEELVMAVFL